MAKITIHCVRHAQGYHNLSTENQALPDPSLTELGEEQCATLSSTFLPHHRDRITHLISSPLRRTLYTTLLSFPTAVQSGLKVIALPELQEISNLPCDIGSDRSKLESEFSTGKFAGSVNLTLLNPSWNVKSGKYTPYASALEARARDARRFLRSLAQESIAETGQEQEIVVVTHGGFLHYLTQDWEGAEKFVGTGWKNTEYRSYEFLSGEDEEAALRETAESRERRTGKEIPLTVDEQRELRSAREREWRECGFQISAGEEAKL